MKTNGVIKLKVNNEDINFTTDCSRDAFIELTKLLNGVSIDYIFVSSMYFDEALTDEELKILTDVGKSLCDICKEKEIEHKICDDCKYDF
tara:strand:- start:6499 stop:6768 length:270 start_codon:yes stop_codon:yes gene_type:complete